MSESFVALGELALRRGGSVDPSAYPDEVFELYSIPAYDSRTPEVVCGAEIGSAKKHVEPNDVMISRIVPHIRRSWVVGASNGHRQIASGEWIIFRDKRIWPQYLRWFLLSDIFHAQFMRTVSGVGGSLLRAKPALVYEIKIPLPPLAEQKLIAGILDAADALRAKRRESLAQLDTLIQSTFLEMFGDPVTNPKGWELRTLAELCENITDCPHSTPKWSDSGVVCLRTSNLALGEWDWTDTRFITDSDYVNRSSRGELGKDDIVLSREGTVGVMALVQEGMRMCMGQRLVQVRPDQSKVDPRFLLHLLLHDLAPNRIGRLMAGSTSKHLNVRDLRAIRILLPPLETQQHFGRVAKHVESEKETAKSHLAELSRLFKSLQLRSFAGEL